MKSDFSRRFYGQVLVNILYSTLVACLVEIFLIANVDMIVNYLEKTQGSLSPALKIFRMGTATTILYVIAGIGIFSLTFLLLQRKSIRYIGKIAAAIQNISEGDLNIQVEVEGDDEFAMMAASLNRMEADIRELMDKERESERTKNELITNVAHDLRTPLTSIISYVGLLKTTDIQDPKALEYIDVLERKSKRLGQLMADLVEASKVTSGNVTVNMEMLNLSELVKQAGGEFESRLEERGFVRGEKEGRSNGYTPLVNRPDYLAAESRSFLERVHGGSLSSLMAALYPEKELSREDIAELERILEKGGK